MQKFLVIWDFDFSLIDSNSDTIIFDVLCPEIRQRMKKEWPNEPKSWPNFMDTMMLDLHSRGFRRKEIESSFDGVKFSPHAKDIVRKIHNQGHHQHIFSGANSVFIDIILKKHQLENCFHAIRTYPASFSETERVRVLPYHHSENPHSCKSCEESMCKGEMLNELWKKEPIVSTLPVIYVGDGSNDVCACVLLNSQSHVFARKGFSLDKLISNLKHDATVHRWESYDELAGGILKILENQKVEKKQIETSTTIEPPSKKAKLSIESQTTPPPTK